MKAYATLKEFAPSSDDWFVSAEYQPDLGGEWILVRLVTTSRRLVLVVVPVVGKIE